MTPSILLLVESIVLMLFMMSFAYAYITLLGLYVDWKNVDMNRRRLMALSFAGLAVVLVSSALACLWLMGRYVP